MTRVVVKVACQSEIMHRGDGHGTLSLFGTSGEYPNGYLNNMKVEVISIGTELTSGQNLDTNCQWLSRRLAEIGLPVAFHTTVADDMDDNVAVFALAAQRADLVIATGGLGPTQDDLTREVIA